MISELERLTELWNDGALTKEEFESHKRKLLDQGRAASASARTDVDAAPVMRKRKVVLIAGGGLVLGAVGLGMALVVDSSHGSSATDASEAVPAELANASWVSGDCSARSGNMVEQFDYGHMIERLPSSEGAGRYAVKYQKTNDGWKIIQPVQSDIYSLADGRIKHTGFEIGGMFISTPNGSVFQRCSKDSFEKIEDVPPRPVKETLRYALWMAIASKDAGAVERIIAKMPSVEGGINGEGDPNGQPDIDTMLSTATREIYQIIQRKRGKLTSGNPEDSYAVAGQPWKPVPEFPTMFQGAFIVPDRVGGCSDPLMTISAKTLTRSIFGTQYANVPERMAVSGNRLWFQNKADKVGGSFNGGIVLELQDDGTLNEIVNLSPSGAPDPTGGKDHYLRCSPMPASEKSAALAPIDNLATAKAAYANSTTAIAAAWQALPANTRQRLLPSQRAWIKQKATDCRNLAVQTAGSPDQQEAARLQCEVGLDKLRIQQLKER